MSATPTTSAGITPAATPITTIRFLHALTAILMIMGIPAALVITVTANDMRIYAPEFTGLYWPLLLLTYALLLCYEVFLACLWKLASRVRTEKIFDAQSLHLTTILHHACWVGAGICTVMEFFIPGPPALGGLIGTGIIALITIALTISVLKYLLIQATAFRVELDEVI